MNLTPDFSRPPSEVPVYVLYLLGLPQDAKRDEIEAAWNEQIVPLLNAGPGHLYQRESMQLMAAGVTGPTAERLYRGTRRGSKLKDAAEREGKIRARQAAAKPPFLKKL